MRVGAKMIAYHDLTGSLQAGKRSVRICLFDPAALQSRIKLGHKPGLLGPAKNF